MFVIKLDAIDSTNEYLKKLVKNQEVDNFTMILAQEQTAGKGQMGASWHSEPGKNMILSVLVKDLSLENFTIFDVNVTIALAMARTLKSKNIPNVQIKWPNDIMAESKKVGGILVENAFKTNGTMTSVIGVGLNLNQTSFDTLPQASSLKNIVNKTFEAEEMAVFFVTELKALLKLLVINVDVIWQEYLAMLFKRNEVCAFENQNGNRFMGIIQNVTRDGKLSIKIEDDSVVNFEVKQVKMLF